MEVNGPTKDPSQWVPRTDAGARKLIERIDQLASKVDRINAQVKRRPTKAAMALAILTAGSTVIGLVYRMTEETKQHASRAVSAHEDKHEGEVLQLRTEFQNAANRQEAKTDKLIELMLRSRRRESDGGPQR